MLLSSPNAGSDTSGDWSAIGDDRRICNNRWAGFSRRCREWTCLWLLSPIAIV